MKKSATLLVNLGSPDSTDVDDVRRYLKEFLSDPRVLDSPYPIRMAVLNFAILPSRPKESAEAYREIWTEEGSPLVVISEKVTEALRQRVEEPIALAMRYGNPSIPKVVGELVADGVEEIFLVPLYPHYAMSSYETVVARVQAVLAEVGPEVKLFIQPPFYDDPDYIDALVAVAKPYMDGGFDHLLFSYHGIPERHLTARDPSGCYCLQSAHCCEMKNPAWGMCYRAQCFETTRRFAAAAGLSPDQYSVAFQSRLGKDPWLKPYTDHRFEALPKEGVKRLLVICPAFVSDCLETLEEIQMRGKESFTEAGGESFEQIPCLNDHPRWLDVLEKFITSPRVESP